MGTARHNPTPITPESIIADAEQQVREADTLAADLETAARGGDDSVTLDQLEDARQRAGWARIRRDAATKKAAQRAEELRHEQYANLMANYLESATEDVTAAVHAELEQALPHIKAALELLKARNRAVWAIAEYASHDVNYVDPDDRLRAETFPQLPAASWFSIHGQRYDFIPATDVIKALLTPIKTQIRDQSGGAAASWIKEI